MKRKPKPPTGNLYRCNVCGTEVRRESSKRWLVSLCERTGHNTRLYLVAPAGSNPKSAI